MMVNKTKQLQTSLPLLDHNKELSSKNLVFIRVGSRKEEVLEMEARGTAMNVV